MSYDVQQTTFHKRKKRGRKVTTDNAIRLQQLVSRFPKSTFIRGSLGPRQNLLIITHQV